MKTNQHVLKNLLPKYIYMKKKINTERLKELTNAVGKDRLVLDLSCRRREGSDDKKYYVVTDRWQKYTTSPSG